jgi:hypothetical protein
METILNITNGDSAVMAMQLAEIPGDFLPWRDVLHDGPVPASLSLEQLSEVRAQFISDQGWGELAVVMNSFKGRDRELLFFRNYSKVRLWFEHDLYDQLQVLQILDWFRENSPGTTNLSIICTEQYLGLASPEQIRTLLQYEELITESHLMLAKNAWSAFRSHDPENWQELLQDDTSRLPFLNGAVLRLLEEYPDYNCGLSRTAQTALKILSQGQYTFGELFGKYQETEERLFLGDLSFWAKLRQLLTSNSALITSTSDLQITTLPCPEQQLTITPAGEKVLAGKQNWLDTVTLDHWIGGVHLTTENSWCWNSKLLALVKQR